MNKGFFTGKKVLVMGLGRFGGGVDAAEFAVKAGAKVTVTDLTRQQQLADSVDRLKRFTDIEFHLGRHQESDFEWADVIIVNPAVPDDDRFLEIARQHNKFITSQINIFFQLCSATVIGVTGTNGKSTTAALIAHLLDAGVKQKDSEYSNVFLGGNIGNRPLLAVIDQIKSNDLVVLELSSFQTKQLAQIQKAPQVALLTNLTPNHLDRHGSFADYCAAKENIFRFQKCDVNHPAVSVFNAADKIGAEWFEKYRSQTGRICMQFSADDISDQLRAQFALPGRANLSNLVAAVCVAGHFGVTDETIESSLPEFKSLPHRLEFVAEKNGVRWYNDSISTTPASSIAALDAFAEPKIIIAGGYDKHLSFTELAQQIACKCKAAILMGATAEKIASAIRNSSHVERNTRYAIRNMQVKIVNSLADAVDSAEQLATSGDIVLLSPGCASYDMFDNFQHRGREFIRLVQGKNNQ
jgi:UDP-N-acetylmuramoylalanine--D-glutamate ligase